MADTPFQQLRRVKWGETDPAQIVYTPRFLDYVVEAVEAWFSNILNVNWLDLRNEFGMGTPMAHASLDFHKPLRSHQEFTVTVLVEKISRATITFRVEGRYLDGTLSFTAKLISVIIDVKRFKSRSIPSDLRTRIETYRKACIEMSQS